jgi:hypothetical protein
MTRSLIGGLTGERSVCQGLQVPVTTVVHHHYHHHQQQLCNRCSVVTFGVAKKRNPIIDIERDVLPDGKPNTPWRRIKLRIQTAVSVKVGAGAGLRGRGARAVEDRAGGSCSPTPPAPAAAVWLPDSGQLWCCHHDQAQRVQCLDV